MLAGVFSPVISKSLASFWSRNELSKHIPVNISTCISNVAGPDFPLYCAGARMVDYYGLGVLTPGMGIFHLVFSYSGKLTLSVLADRDIMPDPEFYHDCLVASYEELYAAAIKLGPRRPKSAAVAAKAKILSPKRKRAGGSAIGKVVPKLQSRTSAAKKPIVKSKPAMKADTPKKVKTSVPVAPKKKVSATAKQHRSVKTELPVAATRLKAKRRDMVTPKPKLK
jgi:hypothetical protein